MISKQFIRYVVIGTFSFMALLQLIMFLKTSDCLCLSEDIDTWNKYGAAFSSWTLPFLTLINGLVLFLVDKQLTANMKIDILKDNKFKVQYAKFETFRTSFLDAHRQLQEAVGFDHQQSCFDNWKTCFYDFYNPMVEISPSIRDCEYMKWWVKEFDAHTKVINSTPEGKYDPSLYSRVWSTNILRLYSELCNFILSGR